MTMAKTWNKLVAKSVKWLHTNGVTKNEVINCGGYRYPIVEFLSFSDEKITDILKNAGATPSDIETTFVAINELRRR